jgi:hypothetical protein
MTTHVWTWGGKFFGYVDGDTLYTYKGKAVGRIKSDMIYGRDGRYIGEVRNGDRLITHRSKAGWTGPAAPSSRRGPIAKYTNYVGYAMYAGYSDFPPPDSFE